MTRSDLNNLPRLVKDRIAALFLHAFYDSLFCPFAVSSLIRARTKYKSPDARRVWNAPTAYEYTINFRQDLQDGQDLNVGLCYPANHVHPVHYVCAPHRFWTRKLAGELLNQFPLKFKSA